MDAHANYLVATGEAGIALGHKYGVVADIHVNDDVFGSLLGAPEHEPGRALDTYLANGRASATGIRDVLVELQGATIVDERITDAMTLLDFASGFGCVTRHLKNVIPQGKVVAMDVRENAKYFNAAHLGVQGVASDMDPGRVKPFFQVDMVFAVALFSRLPRYRIGAWLDLAARFVKVGGVMLFTAQGPKVHRERFAHLRPDSDGYAWEPTSEQHDLARYEFGNAIAYPRLMLREVERLSGIEITMFRSAYWWNDHDLYVLRRVA